MTAQLVVDTSRLRSDEAVALCSRLDVAVILPTLNERDNIVPLIGAVSAVLAGYDHEIIVIDDWSSDGTPEVVREAMLRYPRLRLVRRYGRRGLSSAVVEGMLMTDARVCAVMDADGQHDETLLPRLVEAVLSDSCDIAIGSRYIGDGSTGDWHEWRVRISRYATQFAQRLLRLDLSDPMSGLFVIRRESAEACVPHLSTAGFKILLDLMTSSPAPLRAREFPYCFRSRMAGESKLDGTVVLDFAQMLARKLVHRHASARLILFCFVGLLGLAVHLTVLRTGLGPFALSFPVAQTLAVMVAIIFNYTLNNRSTFADRRRRGWRWWSGFASYFAICGAGAVANIGVGSFVFLGKHDWWVAGVAGAVIGAAWNFGASSLVTWRKA